MRLAGLAVFAGVVATPGRGCNGPEEITVEWALPDGPGTRGVERVGCVGWEVDLIEPHREGCDAREYGGATLAPGWTQCAVRGWRRDGALFVEGPLVKLDRRRPYQVVDLGLDDGPIAGMGAQIRSVGGAVRVERVIPGAPADRAGIAPGDLIVEVDGQSTAGMTSPEFVRAATGLPGTGVDYRVRHPSGREDAVQLVRTRIPADWESRSWEGDVEEEAPEDPWQAW